MLSPGALLAIAHRRFEPRYGPIPAGSVVVVRSGWSERWINDPGTVRDTDTMPTLEGEAELLHHGYAQAEGVANLDAVPPTGCPVSIGFPKLRGDPEGAALTIPVSRPTRLAPSSWCRRDAGS